MRAVLLLLLTGFMAISACSDKKPTSLSAQQLITDPSEGKRLPTTVFTDTTFDFGTVEAGTIVKHSFVFENKGEGDLVISNAQASCGCTVPTFPKEPIPAGGKGKIDVEFNSTGREGPQNKTVTLFANTLPPTRNLVLTGTVRPSTAELKGPIQP